MIKSIEIKNFKSIKGKYFHLRNLNVLMGLNGQGKSSFIQFLLVLRQSFKNQNQEDLQLNGDLVNIGTTGDALYQYADKKDSLAFELIFESKRAVSMQFEYQPGSDVFKQKRNIFSQGGMGEIKESLLTNQFQFLSTHRVKPQSVHPKRYSIVVTNNNIGVNGEYTVDYLETRGDENIDFKNLIHESTARSRDYKGEIVTDRSLLNQVTLWMQEISPRLMIKTTSVATDMVKLEYEFQQETYGKTNAYKPENVGYGISNVLPVVVAILKARKGDLLILENPESQLHPRGQAVIGKMISLLAMNDIQVIVETHSDHIVNGIRVGIKENVELINRTILFYFEKVFDQMEQYSKITNIEFDKNGELSEYPPNLLEEWSNQLFKLL